MVCKQCDGRERVKNGFIRGQQRFKYRDCGCVYTETAPRGKLPAMKALAILLYTMGNASLGMIARLLKVSNVAVLKWVHKEAQRIEKTDILGGDKIIMVDEMWHFVNGKKTKFGSGKPLMLCQSERLGVILER